MSAINIQGITQRLESKERNTDGKEDVEWFEWLASYAKDRLKEEVRILEVREYP